MARRRTRILGPMEPRLPALGRERAAGRRRRGLGTDPLDHVGTREDEPQGPGKGRRRRLVAGHEEGEHVVEQLLVAERPAVLTARLEQHREDGVTGGFNKVVTMAVRAVRTAP